MQHSPQAQSFFAWPTRQWVDLFYDLTFAAGILAISSGYAHDPTLGTAIWLSVAYGVLWGTWLLTGSVTGSFTAHGIRHSGWSIGLIGVQMGALLILALSSTSEAAEADQLFDIFLGVALLTCVALAIRARRTESALPRQATIALGVSLLALLASWFLPDAASTPLWLSALVALGFATWQATSSSGLDGERLAHRLGELTIVVIGETLLKIALTAGKDPQWVARLLVLVPALVTLLGLWWAYFTALGHDVCGSKRRPWVVAAHVPLHLGFLGLAVGMGKLVSGDLGEASGTKLAWMLVAPTALCVGALVVVAYLERERWQAYLIAFAGLIAVAFGLSALSPPDELAGAAVALMALALGAAAAVKLGKRRSHYSETSPGTEKS